MRSSVALERIDQLAEVAVNLSHIKGGRRLHCWGRRAVFNEWVEPRTVVQVSREVSDAPEVRLMRFAGIQRAATLEKFF